MKHVTIATLYENPLGVQAGGFNNNYTENGVSIDNPVKYDENGNIILISSEIIQETENRRFVSDELKNKINNVLLSAMTKSVYDTDLDGIIDKAKDSINSETANIANVSNKSLESDHALETDHSLNSDNAIIANKALELEEDENHRTVSDNQIESWDNKQEKINYIPENIANKGVADGYVPLGADLKINDRYLNNVKWGNIENIPLATIDEIDDAVNKKHLHSNINVLDKLSENNDKLPLWNGVEWPYPGNMRSDLYDTNNDGVVDRADIANSVPYSGISGGPSSSAANIDDAVNKKHNHNNIEALSLLQKDSNNLPLWNDSEWPYNMKKEVYDSDSDGMVDIAKFAKAVNWNTVNNRPESNVEDIDNSVLLSHEHVNLDSLNNINMNLDETRPTFKGKELALKEDVYNSTTDQDGNVIKVKHSITIDETDNSIHLVNDEIFPAANTYYGTDRNQNLGYHQLPDFKYTGINSIIIDQLGRTYLKNDNPDPGTNKYYGSNSSGELGYYDLPKMPDSLPMPSEIDANIIIENDQKRFISKEQYDNLNTLINQYEDSQNPDSKELTGNVIGNGTRECIISADDDLFALNGSDLIIRAAENNPILASFSVDKNNEILRVIKENLTVVNVPSIINNGTAYIYLFIDKDTKTVKASKSNYKPIYAPNMPNEKENGRYWFNINTYTMYVSDGEVYTQVQEPTLFIGEIYANNGKVYKTIYAYNGYYDSGWYNVNYGTTYNKNHNIGTDLLAVYAYKGYNNVNYGTFDYAIHGGATFSDTSPIGDRVTKITDTSIQTTRYSNLQYGNIIYSDTNQHRVIVKRLW